MEKINLLRQDDSLAGLTERPAAHGVERMVAGYLSKPLLPGNFGAAEVLDPGSGLSVQGWSTFFGGGKTVGSDIAVGGSEYGDAVGGCGWERVVSESNCESFATLRYGFVGCEWTGSDAQGCVGDVAAGV